MTDPTEPYRMLIAYVRPNRRKAVSDALRGAGILGTSWSQVDGVGEAGGGETEVPHVRMEIVVPVAQVEECSKAIAEAAHTGETGDGVVAVLPVQGAFRIRSFRPL